MKPWAWVAALALLATCGIAVAQSPQGEPRTGTTPSDPDFGVKARRGFGLERQVRMYQWQRSGQGYDRAWLSEAVDSSGFAPGHRNPVFPLQGARWIADDITLDGKPLGPEVVSALGQWQAMRPDFSALPGNLSVTFQPEGDGLGSAVDPLQPQIGDLRIRWRELILPPLAGKVELRDGRWQLRPEALAAPTDASTATNDRDVASSGGSSRPWWLAAFAIVLAVGGAWWWRRRRR